MDSVQSFSHSHHLDTDKKLILIKTAAKYEILDNYRDKIILFNDIGG